MKALSLHQPWAALLACGIKTIECRPWNTNYRGDFLIHASKTVDEDAYDRLGEQIEATGLIPDVIGAIIGKATLVEVKTYLSNDEFEDDYKKHYALNYFTPDEMQKRKAHGFVIRNPTPFNKAIACKGMLNFFSVPKAILEAVESTPAPPPLE